MVARVVEPVSLDRHSTTVTKVVEGCVYIRRRFNAISLMRGELQHSALCSFSPHCPLKQQRKEHSSDSEAVRASRLGLYEKRYQQLYVTTAQNGGNRVKRARHSLVVTGRREERETKRVRLYDLSFLSKR